MFPSVEWGFQGAQELINLHPIFVHFPIALLLASAVFYFLGTIFRKEELLAAGKWAIYIGTLSALIAVITGLQAANTVPHNDETHQIIIAHQYVGFVILGLSILLSFWLIKIKASFPKNGKPIFLLALLLLGALIAQQADFGGRLVFLHGVGVGRKSMLQELESNHHNHHEHTHHH